MPSTSLYVSQTTMWKRMQGKVGAGQKQPPDTPSPISPLDLYQPQSWDSRATYSQPKKALKDVRDTRFHSEQSLPDATFEDAEIRTAQQGHRRQASSVYSQYPTTPGLTSQQNQYQQQPDNMNRYGAKAQASTAFQDKVRDYEATVEISPPSSPDMSPIHVPQLTGPTTSMSFMPSSPPLRMQVPIAQQKISKNQAKESNIPVMRREKRLEQMQMGRKPVGQTPGMRNVGAQIKSSYDPHTQRSGSRKLSENQWETVNSLDSFAEESHPATQWTDAPEPTPTVTNLEDMYGAPYVKQPTQTFSDRVRKIKDAAGGKRTPPLATNQRPGWKGGSGRAAIVPAPEDNLYVEPLSIPRKSSKRVPSIPTMSNSRNGTPTAETPRSRTPMTESPLSTMTAKPQNYFSQNAPPPRTSSAGPAAAPRYDENYEDRFSEPSPASPLDSLPSQKNRSVSNLVPGAFPQSGAPTPNLPSSVSTIERNFVSALASVNVNSSPPNTSHINNNQSTHPAHRQNTHPAYRNHQPNEVSRFSVTTYATNASASPRTSTDSAPPVPEITYSKYRNPSLYSLASNSSKDSILNRKRPVAPKEHTFDATTAALERPELPSETTLKVIAIREHQPDKSKALPKSPAELSQSDKCLALQAQLDDLAQQKVNIEKSISAMTTLVTSQMTGIPPGLDLEGRKREMERRDREKKKVEGLKEELARVKSQEHEVGIKLHRALRKRDESGGYEPSGLWVRRVTG